MEKDDFDRHFYLYAKGHYKAAQVSVHTLGEVDEKPVRLRKDTIRDLKVLMGKRCGYEPEETTVGDVLSVLLSIAYPHIIKLPENMLKEFLVDLSYDNAWKYGADPNDTYAVRLCHKLLSILSLTKVCDIPFELGEPDPSILPLKEKS
jgi:hypothetical protein